MNKYKQGFLAEILNINKYIKSYKLLKGSSKQIKFKFNTNKNISSFENLDYNIYT